jgi:hypothetical protein
MVDFSAIGRWLVIAGVFLALVGGAIWLLGRFLPAGARLPGTLRIETGGLTCVIPILLSIILSVVLTVGLNLLLPWLNK